MARDPTTEDAHPTSDRGLTRVQFQSLRLYNFISPMTQPVTREE
jgi:hypothetical protein